MNWTLLIIGAVAAYFLGHVLHSWGISVGQMALGLAVWLVLGLVVGLLFGATVKAGDR